MGRPTILVTGATGKTGSAVVERLLARGWPVRALAHRADARAAQLWNMGAEVAVVSAHDPIGLRDALKGIARAYYVPIFAPHATQAAAAFATAAADSQLEALVQMSQWISSPAHPSILTRETWLIDRMFAMLPNLAHIIVNPGMFADNFLRTIDMATLLGLFPVLTGDSRSAPVSTEDLADCIVELLVDPEHHAGQSWRPTGPRLMSGADMAAAVARAIGRPVRPLNLSFGMFLKVARLDGVNPHEVLNWRDYVRDHQAGVFEMGGGVTDVVKRLTGHEPEPFEMIARRYAARPATMRTPSNLARMLGRMAILPLVPQLDIEAFAGRHGFPEPPSARLAARDDGWIESHLGTSIPAAAE